MALNWESIGGHIADGRPFEMQFARVDGGLKVRVLFEGGPPLECDQVWANEEEALGRGFQLADSFIEDTLR